MAKYLKYPAKLFNYQTTHFMNFYPYKLNTLRKASELINLIGSGFNIFLKKVTIPKIQNFPKARKIQNRIRIYITRNLKA